VVKRRRRLRGAGSCGRRGLHERGAGWQRLRRRGCILGPQIAGQGHDPDGCASPEDSRDDQGRPGTVDMRQRHIGYMSHISLRELSRLPLGQSRRAAFRQVVGSLAPAVLMIERA
jgi:hypothetical protein